MHREATQYAHFLLLETLKLIVNPEYRFMSWTFSFEDSITLIEFIYDQRILEHLER